MSCEFSKLWYKTIDPDKCSGPVEVFGSLSQNVRPELEKFKSAQHDSASCSHIDIKTLVANRISPFDIEEHLAKLNICQFHLVRKLKIYCQLPILNSFRSGWVFAIPLSRPLNVKYQDVIEVWSQGGSHLNYQKRFGSTLLNILLSAMVNFNIFLVLV